MSRRSFWIGRAGCGSVPLQDWIDYALTAVPSSTFASIPRPGSVANPGAVRALHVDSHDVLWIGTAAGLDAWSLGSDPPGQRVFGADNGLTTDPVQSILEDHNGVIWVGTLSTGLLRWDAENNRFISYRHQIRDPHSLADDDIDSLFQDRSGTLWVGTHINGISRIDLDSGGFERFVGLSKEQGTRDDDKVYSVAADRANNVWIGTVGGGLLRIDRAGGQLTAFRHDPADAGSPCRTTLSIPCMSMRGIRVWAGTGNGLARFDPKTRHFWIRHLTDHDPLLDAIRFVGGGRSGILWIGTDGGLHRYDPATDSLRTFRHDPNDPYSLGQGRVSSVPGGPRWNAVGWYGRRPVDRWDADTGHFTTFPPRPQPSRTVSATTACTTCSKTAPIICGSVLRADSIVSTSAATACRAFAAMRKRTDLVPTQSVRSLRTQSAGSGSVLQQASQPRFDPATATFRNYTARDGLLDGSYYLGSAYAASDGEFYFGGLSGLTAFRPDAIRDNPVPPPVVITQLQIFNRPVEGAQVPDGVLRLDGTIEAARALQLSHANSVFSLEFAALHYADPLRNRYAYQLVGFDPDWIQTDASRRFATYTNLNPGHYVFRVKASNKDGVWNATGATLDITIEPPYWATWWFRGLAAALLLGERLCVVPLSRVRGLTRQRALHGEEDRARTAEVVKQKEDIEQAHSNLSVLEVRSRSARSRRCSMKAQCSRRSIGMCMDCSMHPRSPFTCSMRMVRDCPRPCAWKTARRCRSPASNWPVQRGPLPAARANVANCISTEIRTRSIPVRFRARCAH